MAKAFLGQGETRQLVFEDIASLEVQGGKIHFTSLFGDTKTVEGHLLEIDFQSGSVILEAP